MAVAATMVKRNVQKCSTGFVAHMLLLCIAVLCTDLFALRDKFMIPPSLAGSAQVQVDFLLWVLVAAYLIDAYSARATGPITSSRKQVATKPAFDRVVSDGRRPASPAAPTAERAPPAKPDGCQGSSADSGDLSGQECWRQRSDLQVVSSMLAEGVPYRTSKVLEVMHSCIRLGHGDAAVKLFDEMLQTGPTPKAHHIGKAVSHKFFKLVSDTLDDKRIQEDGLRLLDLVRAHGIAPAPATQNRLLDAWKNQLPDSFLSYFLELKDAGFILSRWAYRYIVVAHERSDPAFALKIYSEMEVLGIQLDRAAYNSVLGARFQLGMLDEARELFLRMNDSSLVPNEKTFGIMIKVYSAKNDHEGAIALFGTMQEQRMEPDRYAYHHAIRSSITLQRVEYAVDLYNDMLHKKVPPLMNTVSILSGACASVGWHARSAELLTHLARAKEAEAEYGLQR
ncbi:unnamed protein product [Prorocentrum cordatum]|uniref:PROP1-like PPR domain-containing protein n=1 Tax=Prorocentrum cordatum TaxID=2364126 RepID=A0ABN9XU75_9DINO|nr:unnamed protein product [Polarella glacialis]